VIFGIEGPFSIGKILNEKDGGPNEEKMLFGILFGLVSILASILLILNFILFRLNQDNSDFLRISLDLVSL